MWLIYALLTIFSYAGLGYFMKRMAGKINDFLGIIIMSAVSIIPALAVLLFFNFPVKKLIINSNGFLYAALAGICLGIGTLSFLKLFDTGINLSLASPMVRVGILIATVSLGAIVLKEGISIKEWIGLSFAFIVLLFLIWT